MRHAPLVISAVAVALCVAACAKQEEPAADTAAVAQAQSNDVASAAQAVATEPAAQQSTQAADAATVAEHHNMPASGLVITELKPGTGPQIQAGKHALVHYTGWLYAEGAPDKKGKKFDSSVDRGTPFSFGLGGGEVIRGWDEGVVGMQVGGQRRLVIPPDMAYGERGAGGGLIPPGATLVFDVELVGIK